MNAPARLTQGTERALAALWVDPAGLKGLALRARMGPARQAFETALSNLPGNTHRLHPGLSDEQLFGGLNIAASLAEGRPVREPGLVDRPGLFVLTMAERCGAPLAAKLSQILDNDGDRALILLDEGASPEELAPATLMDRLAFHIEPEESARPVRLPASADLDDARARLKDVEAPEEALSVLAALAVRFGIDSLRAPLLALRAARALAALDYERKVSEAHIREAVELIYPPRATLIPQDPAEPEPPQPENRNEPPADEHEGKGSGGEIPDEILVEAILARLPADILDRAAARQRHAAAATGTGAGDRRKSQRRGRPLPSRPGHPSMTARVDPVATLRAAAPWQSLRRRPDNAERPVIIYPSDIRIRRYEERADRLLIFAVDASGSAALARLAEAKGAVELLLAQAYARRDQVALLAFRGSEADLMLPPTRSLVQAKKRLSALPGGGGTPLSAGLACASDQAALARSKGSAPMLVLLTDGKANIMRDGQADRTGALDEACKIAERLAASGLPAIVVDTSRRPSPQAQRLADALRGRYAPLPRADAQKISRVVGQAVTV
ncbi:MAG: magnesium chelatase subunit D [Pseudomonadota bacterium]